jgi:hypothetical protein
VKACRDFRSALRALLEGELALERTLELEQHARECDQCGPELERARALERALLALPPAPVERLDLGRNVRAVLARIDAPAPVARLQPRLLRYAPWAAAAALAVLLGVRLLQPAPPQPQAPLVQAMDPDLDTARLESARSEICAALRECLPEFDPACADAQAFAAAVDARTLELARAGWPRAALVQAAAADADAQLAARALRWLGVRGESPSRVRAALARAELAPSAVAALLDLGASGIEELRRAPESAALRTQVLQQHARAAQALLVPWFEDVLARGRADAAESRQLADALVQCGPAALPALLRLSTRGALAEEEALARLAHIPRADEALGELLGEARASGIDERLLLLAVAEVGVQGGWGWVEREVREGRHEADALAALARGTPEALAALLRLRAGSGVDAEALQRTLERVLREHPDSAAALAREGRSRTELAQLFELASAAPEPALVPALLELAGSEALPEPDRRWALLLAAEQGRAEDLAQALALFPRLRERTLQAACLIALHALGGSAPVESALERRTAALRRRVLALLEDAADARGNLTTLARLARAIESSLPAPQT